MCVLFMGVCLCVFMKLIDGCHIYISGNHSGVAQQVAELRNLWYIKETFRKYITPFLYLLLFV